MPKRLSIVDVNEVTVAICKPVTKFGGQPCWIDEPAWPLSPRLGKPMRFAAQIRLPVEIVGETLANKLAYFFVTDDQDSQGRFVFGGCLGDGESAVIVQPGIELRCGTVAIRNGPSVFTYDEKGPRGPDGRLTRTIDEFAVTLEWGEDPEFASEGVIWGWDFLDKPDSPEAKGWPEDKRNQYYQAVQGTKIGGTPNFFQGDAWPKGDDWIFLLQVETQELGLNLGDFGTGFLFLSRDGRRSEYIVQSH
jgi:hypothetical protein